MRKSGQITVFLSLIILCICSLVCGLVESARMAGAGWYLKQAADSAMDSVFSEYHREVWDNYRVFLLEYESEEEIADSWLKYMEPYMETHSWYPLVMNSASATHVTGITDEHGIHMKQEIQDFMRYGIWDMDLLYGTEGEGAGTLWKNLKEVESVQVISKAYGGHAREAVRVERALEVIRKSLEHQEDDRNKAAAKLRSQDGNGFRAAVKALETEIDRLPGLLKAYGKCADELAGHLEETKNSTILQQEALSRGVRETVNEELYGYESYVLQNGEKRKEIEALQSEAERNLSRAYRAVERSHEVEEEIEGWDEEEEEEHEETHLWRSVERIWDEVVIPGLSFQVGVKEPEKQNLLEQIERMANLDLLALVLPEGTEVSKGVLERTDFPSITYETSSEEGGEKGWGEESGKAEGEKLKDSFPERLLTDEYADKFLTCFLSKEEKEVQYEREYLIGGKNTDEENLKQAAARILAVREGLNLIHILSDSEKRAEARALAGTITGLVGAAPLVGIVAFFVMTVWALGESIADLKALFAGNQIPFIKARETWKLSLDQLLSFGEQGTMEKGQEKGSGQDYDSYLKLLLFMEPAGSLYYRLMDVIQMNIRRTQPGFAIGRCAWKAELQAAGTGKHLFFLGGEGLYSIGVSTDKAY